jgi:hypothetical protein
MDHANQPNGPQDPKGSEQDRRHSDRRQAERRDSFAMGGRRIRSDRRRYDRRIRLAGAGLLASMAFAVGGHEVLSRTRPRLDVIDVIEASRPAPAAPTEASPAEPTSFRETLEPIIQEAAAMHGLPASLIRAVIQTESQFNPLAVSRVGAKGLMQLMPRTAQHVGIKNPFDPRENVLGGTKYLSTMFERFKGNTARALAAYNAGPTTVSRYRGLPPYRETQGYVRKIHKLVADTDAAFSLPAPARVVRKASLKRGSRAATVRKASARKASVRKAAARKASVRKAAARKASVRKAAARKASVRKASAKRPVVKKKARVRRAARRG